MSQVINLRGYRSKTRKAYLAKYGPRLDHILTKFIQTNIEDDFEQMAQEYQAVCQHAHHVSWDYVRFRELLVDAMDEAFGHTLYAMLLKQPWFDAKLLPRDEIVERCLSMFIMSDSHSIARSL